jgi:hypothetical protein
MGMFAKRIQKKEQLVRNGAAPLETANVRQEAKTERARANRLRLNAAKKHNGGNQMRGGQNKKKGRKAPKWQGEVSRWVVELIPVAVPSLDNETSAMEGVGVL